MGSPLSSFLTEAVMQDLEQSHTSVKKDKVDNILHTTNNATKNITFTKEEEPDNKLAFLDVLLTKTNDGNLNTQVYRKKTHY